MGDAIDVRCAHLLVVPAHITRAPLIRENDKHVRLPLNEERSAEGDDEGGRAGHDPAEAMA